MTTIKPCLCQHDYQDKIYGKGKRVHNFTTDGARCTVCGNVKITAKPVKKVG